ncbi:unnamed protein product [Phyllotreta striolata]|uniref:Uncharacterized protein n=1 Tax=Phyllotreta striolata TaxID=444603 RepID=A0A9P0GXS6_PHYSR|nr:unnamed protein product [Phyllotreta striolata]
MLIIAEIMLKGKIFSLAVQALDVTKMVLVITANTAVKLASEGRKEIIKQYGEYQKFKVHPNTTKALADKPKLAEAASQDGIKKKFN